MSNLGDMNKLMKDMMGNFPFDTVAIEKAVKKSKLNKLNLTADKINKNIYMKKKPMIEL